MRRLLILIGWTGMIMLVVSVVVTGILGARNALDIQAANALMVLMIVGFSLLGGAILTDVTSKE